jgi:hypothetical protein
VDTLFDGAKLSRTMQIPGLRPGAMSLGLLQKQKPLELRDVFLDPVLARKNRYQRLQLLVLTCWFRDVSLAGPQPERDYDKQQNKLLGAS